MYYCSMKLYDAISQMRRLSANNIPFSISFVSLNQTKGTSNGVKNVSKCLLRKGLSKDESDKANLLIGYTDLSDNTNKWFYLPLLLKYNNIELE